MTANELIEKLKQYDPETTVKLDYGGQIVDIDAVYDCDDFVFVG